MLRPGSGLIYPSSLHSLCWRPCAFCPTSGTGQTEACVWQLCCSLVLLRGRLCGPWVCALLAFLCNLLGLLGGFPQGLSAPCVYVCVYTQVVMVLALVW